MPEHVFIRLVYDREAYSQSNRKGPKRGPKPNAFRPDSSDNRVSLFRVLNPTERSIDTLARTLSTQPSKKRGTVVGYCVLRSSELVTLSDTLGHDMVPVPSANVHTDPDGSEHWHIEASEWGEDTTEIKFRLSRFVLEWSELYVEL